MAGSYSLTTTAIRQRCTTPAQETLPYSGSKDIPAATVSNPAGPLRQTVHPSGSKWRRMPGLVDGKLRAVWQADYCEKPPALIGDIPGHFGSLAPQLGEGGLNVITHEVQLVMARTFSRVNSKLGRRQSENEPASARVYRGHAHHVCEERADLLSLRREHDRMYPGNHAAIIAADRANPGDAGGRCHRRRA